MINYQFSNPVGRFLISESGRYIAVSLIMPHYTELLLFHTTTKNLRQTIRGYEKFRWEIWFQFIGDTLYYLERDVSGPICLKSSEGLRIPIHVTVEDGEMFSLLVIKNELYLTKGNRILKLAGTGLKFIRESTGTVIPILGSYDQYIVRPVGAIKLLEFIPMINNNPCPQTEAIIRLEQNRVAELTPDGYIDSYDISDYIVTSDEIYIRRYDVNQGHYRIDMKHRNKCVPIKGSMRRMQVNGQMLGYVQGNNLIFMDLDSIL